MANRIREQRERAGLSQTKLACIIGVAQGNLSRVENGKMYAWPRLRHSLCEALEATEEVLFPAENSEKA